MREQMPDTLADSHPGVRPEPFGGLDNRLCFLTRAAFDEMKIIKSVPNVLPIPPFHQDTVAMTKNDIMKESFPGSGFARLDGQRLLQPLGPGDACLRKRTIITFWIFG